MFEETDEIRELKTQVQRWKKVAIGLAVALTFSLGLIPLAVVAFLLALPILAFTHQYLPRLARMLGRCCSWVTATGKAFASYGDHSVA